MKKDRDRGKLPSVKWSTGGLTGVKVGVYGWGAGASRIRSLKDNTDIFDLLCRVLVGAEVRRERGKER